MTRREIGVAAAALVLGGGAGWWAAPRERPVDPGLSGEVVALRRAADEQDARLERLEAAAKGLPAVPAEVRDPPAVEDRDRGAAADPESRIAALEKEVAALDGKVAASRGPAPEDPVVRSRKVLEAMKGITDPKRQVAIRDAVEEIARIGDPAVPEVVAVLDSGADRLYHGKAGRMAIGQGSITYGGLRMALIDSLRQTGTPVAKASLLKAVGRSRTLADYRDLLVPYSMTTDPALIEGISALVPDMLKRLAETGIPRSDPVAQELAQAVAQWIQIRGLSAVASPLAETLPKVRESPTEWGWSAGMLFGALLTVDPERAAGVVLAAREESQGRESLRLPNASLAGWRVPLSCWARYGGAALSGGDLGAGERLSLYSSFPTGPCSAIENAAKRIEDAQVLIVFLEARLEAEPEARWKPLIEDILKRLRESIARAER